LINKKKGEVSVRDLKNIFESFGRSPEELESILSEIGFGNYQELNQITFSEFVLIMQRLENEMDRTHEEIEPEDVNRGRKEQQNKFINQDLRDSDPYEQKFGKNNLTTEENDQDEPTPPQFEVVDEDPSSESQPINLDTDEGYIPDPEEKENQYQQSDNPIIESDPIEEQEESTTEGFQVRSKSVAETESSTLSFQHPKPPTDKERKLYGAMLPRNGVYFLPELKVVDYIRVLNNYKRQCLKEGKIVEVK